MYEYYLETAGLKIKLESPTEISFPKSICEFLVDNTEKNADCSIIIKMEEILPKMGEKGYWHGPEYYDYENQNLRIFHSTSVKGEPFSVTVIDEKGNIEIVAKKAYAEYFSGGFGIFNRIGIENFLLNYNGLMLHSSFVKYKGVGILFCGPSGVGKSTQADLWKKHSDAEIVNGDRTILRKQEGKWIAYGSFFSGTSGIALNDSASLEAIILLSKGEKNSLKKLAPSEAMLGIYPELSLNRAVERIAENVTGLCMELIADVPIYRFICTPDKDAVTALKEGLDL